MPYRTKHAPTFGQWEQPEWAIQYSIWLKKEWWKITTVRDQNWNVTTNIHWMVTKKANEIFSDDESILIVPVEHDMYARINACETWTEEKEDTRIKVSTILDNLYKKYEKAA